MYLEYMYMILFFVSEYETALFSI